MSTAIWITLVVATAVASFFIGSLITKRQYEHDELEKEVERAQSDLEQFKQDVSLHAAHTNKLMGKMQESYLQLVKHMEETNQLLVAKNDTEVVPFFSQEATEILSETRDNDVTRTKILARNAELQAPPADFVTGETGIFRGDSSENKQTESA
ncbi:ZapG family protein [Pseudoalteromonas sp.]|uniref:ZapG family protein n=1 Tax=Pseudoalteromonas sp. TaxID=53249 RepID=UPI0035660E28